MKRRNAARTRKGEGKTTMKDLEVTINIFTSIRQNKTPILFRSWQKRQKRRQIQEERQHRQTGRSVGAQRQETARRRGRGQLYSEMSLCYDDVLWMFDYVILFSTPVYYNVCIMHLEFFFNSYFDRKATRLLSAIHTSNVCSVPGDDSFYFI